MTDDLHPEFVRDALAGTEPSAQRELGEVVHRLPEALPFAGRPTGLRERLLSETSRPPERYAPFTRRLSELYDLPRDDVRASSECANQNPFDAHTLRPPARRPSRAPPWHP